ncbi:hypothetical protein Mext_2457 [Methylorubrum extorquens PA1]|nr:hypothetical protein Mext_2457 [Methylorubrum extorquens PA1]
MYMDHRVADGNETLNFLRPLFHGASTGTIVLWMKQTKKSEHFALSDIEKAAARAVELAAAGDVYTGRGLQTETLKAGKRGVEADVCFVSGLFADIDLRGGAHSADATRLPGDAEEAMSLIAEAGLPAPTLVVFTGGGVHAHWTFTNPRKIETSEDRAEAKVLSEAWQARLRRTFSAHGFILDGTADLSRVVRIPGTVNRKGNGSSPVRVIHNGERIEEAAAIALVVGKVLPRPDVAAPKDCKVTDLLGAGSFTGSRLPELEPLLTGCAFARHCIEDVAMLPEPHWYRWLGLCGRCEDGYRLAHETSATYHGYTPEGTDAKLTQALTAFKPMTCQWASGEFEGCRTCPFFGTTHSPIALGYQKTPIVAAQVDAVYDLETDRYYVPSTGDLVRPKAVQALNRAKVGRDPLDQMHAAATMPMVGRLDYLPGDNRLMIAREVGRPVANMWRPDGVIPAESTDGAEPILRHFDYLFPKAAEREHILDYLAHMLRHPGVKIAHGLMVTGPQGTGKTTIGIIVRGLIGDRNARKVEGDELADKWTSRLVNVQALVIEEAAHGQRYEIYERFKELFTGETFTVQDKQVPLYNGRCPRGVLLLTNHEAAITVTGNDRRFHVSETTEVPAPPEYFAALYAALDDGVTLPAFAAWLMQRDIWAFNPKAKPPMTEAKIRAQEASLTPTADALKTLLAGGVAPFHRDVTTVEEVRAALLSSGYFPATERLRTGKVTAAIKDVGGRRLNDGNDMRLPGGTKIRPWAIRDGARWAAAGLDEIKAEYARSPGTVRPAGRSETANVVLSFPVQPGEPVYRHRTLEDYLQSVEAAGAA